MELWPQLLCLLALALPVRPQCLPSYEYADAALCRPCAPSCLNCYDAATCLQCMPQYYLEDYSCRQCSFGCAVCSGSAGCLTCNDGLYLTNEGSCSACAAGVATCTLATVQTCQKGYFLLASICAGCLAHCNTCSDFLTCSDCASMYYLSADSASCMACSAHCLTCTDGSTCIECEQAYSISGGVCQANTCSSIDPFCVSCSSGSCSACEQGKYLEGGQCKQGGSLLCLEAVGPYNTNCETSNYGCPAYTELQTDQMGTQLPVCLPLSATQLAEYLYLTTAHPTCTACTTPTTLPITYNTRQAYYQLNYHFRLRLLGSLPTRTLTLALTNSTATLLSRIHTVSVTRELAAFTGTDSECVNCRFAEVIVSGSLSWAGGEYGTNLSIADGGGVVWMVEGVVEHLICQVAKCSNCSSAVDCYSCFSPYLLQLTTCVSACDAGFYLYERICYLQCPLSTYTLSFNYTCTPCLPPCLTCANATHCLTCRTTYFLQGTACLTVCSSLELFANSTSGKCEDCPNPCVSCNTTGNGSVVCLSCAEGYLLERGSCSYVCPWGQFGNFLNAITQCSNCSSECSSCSLNSTVCGACNSGYLLLDSSCLALSTCPVGYYSNLTLNRCLACHYPCAACSSSPTHCLSCVRGSLFQNACLNECPASYYSDYSSASNTSCQPCQSPCSSCSSLSSCRTCLSGFYLHGVSCLSACPTYFYADSSNSSCVGCIPPCKSCINATACLSCTTGYLDNTTCTLVCNSSAYVSSSFQCTICPSPCLSCYSSTNCLRCQLPYLLLGSSCISQQQCLNTSGYYPDYSPNASLPLWGGCNTCTFPCSTCANTSVGCLSCANTYLFVSDMHSCVSVCPTSYFQSNTSCLPCAVSCYQCSLTATNCTLCSSGMYLLTSNGSCVTTCPDGYYGDDATQSCVSCSPPCKTCYSTYLCSSCLTGILYSKQCVSTCPSSTFLNTTINSCLTCTSNCLTCSSPSTCLSCISGYYLTNATCLAVCPSTSFGNDYTRTCDSCSAPCSNCSSASRCLDCVSGYYFYNGVCTTTCSAGKYADNFTFTCKLCNSSICLTCQNDPNNCLTCISNYFFEGGICQPTCSSGKYANSATATCDDCPFPCSACNNYSHCTNCLTNYLLHSSHCFSRCPQGYFPSNNSCLPCSSTCQICSSSTVCLQCSSGYLVLNGACVVNCLVGWFAGVLPISNYDSCIQCQSDCLNCSAYDYCLQCVAPGIAFNGLCLDSCPIFYYSVNASACAPCSPYCSNCTNSTLCLNCAASYLYLGACTAACPAQTFPDSSTCQPCLPPCFNCTSNFTCLSCLPNLIYFHSYCVSACPSDVWFYPHNNSCAVTCPYNKYASNMTCFIGRCGHSMVSLNGYCLQECSIGYYVNLQQQCVLCNGASACSNLFKADLQIVYSDRLTLSLYFNQKAELAAAEDVNITFVDIEGKPITRNYTSFEITSFKIEFQFDYQSVELVNISMQIPYVASQESQQCISSSLYKAELPIYNDYSSYQSVVVGVLPLIVIALLFVLIVINVCNKASRFTQMLDYTQLIAVTLYLDVQYPPILEDFLSGFKIALLSLTKNMIGIVPYSFSPPKFIFYHTDTSLFRNQLILLLVFLIVLIVFIAIIAVHTYNPNRFISAVKLIRYRLLNDLFSLCITPLFLFGCQLKHATPADIFIAILLGILGIGYVGWISYKIVEVKKMEELAGLLGDFERTESKLGLMYTPFAFVRRIILTFGLGISPFSPISTLTLLLVFTILIMICIYFYQPFDNQYTDYVTIFMQSSLTLYVLCLIILALEVLAPASSHNLGVFCVSLVSITTIISLAWLIYLTANDIRTKGCCPKSKEETTDLSKIKDDYSEGHHQKEAENKSKNEKEAKGNKKEEVQDQSAHQFLHRISGKSDQIFSKSHQNEQFKHWSEESSNKQEPFSKKQMGLPHLLFKKEVNPNPSKA